MAIQFVCNLVLYSGFEVVPAWFRKSMVSRFMSTATSHVMHHRYSRGNYGFVSSTGTKSWAHAIPIMKPSWPLFAAGLKRMNC